MPIYRANDAWHLFCHVPKCGGTTVEKVLAARFGPLGFFDGAHFKHAPETRWSMTSPQHIAMSDLRGILPDGFLETSFATIRDPFARVVSAFHHVQAKRRIPEGTTLARWFGDYVRHYATRPFRYDNHLRPQVDLVGTKTRIFRLEDGLDAVGRWLDETHGASATDDGFQRENVGRDHRHHVLQDRPVPRDVQAKIAAFYADDFARFDYDPAPSDARTYRQAASPLSRRVRRLLPVGRG